jgi:tol-pal system protein YbgF
MRKMFFTMVLLLFVGLGCATRRDITQLESSMAEMKVKNDEVAQQVDKVKELVLLEQDLIMSAKADILAEIGSLREQVYMMENRISEGEGEVLFEFGSRVEEGEITSPPLPDGVAGEGEGTGSGRSGEGEPPAVNERITYDTAFLDMTRGNYQLAIDGFVAFIKSSDGSQLLDNSQYWIGECFYAMGDLRRAIEEFEKVVDNYPRGNKIPSALFKIGKCYFELDDHEAAGRYFQSVVDGYPRSEESNLARDYLAEL